MKFLSTLLMVAGVLLMLAGSPSARAQFTSNTAFTSEGQVLTTGTEVWGGRANYGGGTFTLANGVSFNTQFINATYVGTALSGVQVDVDGAYRADYTGVSAFSDSALNNVLTYDSTGSYGVFNIKGLTAGATYTVQFFAAMTGNGDYTSGGGAPVEFSTEDVSNNTSGGSSTLSFGQAYDAGAETYSGTGVYTVSDTFTAGLSGIQNFYFSSPTSQTVQIAAGQIRMAPEPSTYAMLFGGLAVLGFLMRRKALLNSI
jgi:hypothetical protein